MTRKLALALATSGAFGAAAMGMLGFDTVAIAQPATIGVHVLNTESDDIFVTLTDVNSGQSRPILDNVRINSRTRTTIQVVKDQNGRGKVSWTSKISADDPRKVKCGKGQESGFNVGSEIKISAHSSC